VGLWFSGTATAEDQVRIFVPAFTGMATLGKNVSNVLRLQISQTFRESDGTGNTFGRGVLLWDDRPLKELSHDEAMRRATTIGTLAHLVLWGTAIHYGDGVVVQSYLTVSPLVSFRERKPEVLAISVNTPSGKKDLSLDIPSVHYNFRPRVLRKEIVDKYQTISNLPIYSDQNFQNIVGSIGPEFRAHQYQKDAVNLTSGKVTGWVPLPSLADSHSEIISFTSAIIRILRGDWVGARELLEQTAKSDNLPQAILIDTTIYNGVIEEKLGRSGLRYFYSAYDLNKFNKVSAQYVIIGLVSEKLRLEKSGKSTKNVSEEASRFLRESNYLFVTDESWMENARAILSES
jgi:hypothetical protein